MDSTAAPWRSLARVQTGLGGRCTGVLLAPRLVLTAAHCLVGRTTRRLVRPGSVNVLLGYARGDWTAHARARAFAVSSRFDPEAGGPPAADWALLTLESPLGGEALALRPAASPAPGTAAALGGYEQDRNEVLLADSGCRVLGPVRGASPGDTMLRHDCAATRGSSGAPLLVREDGAWRVAGLQVRAMAGGAGGLAIPADAIPGLSLGLPGGLPGGLPPAPPPGGPGR
ncbi:trypsin-like peptidase domain-containing protein [Roseomonas sp. NAR14]|uniref:Trypsin-like peptidase domain-containing protein n=1 Tax=Roseomonas acroporae TaxID=2937791 RepID=A0A9X1Y7G2_9PROT|nr:trypsin-like peptidase domain-containing protein [Roseomonas acroporae]